MSADPTSAVRLCDHDFDLDHGCLEIATAEITYRHYYVTHTKQFCAAHVPEDIPGATHSDIEETD